MRTRALTLTLATALLSLTAVGCRQNMHNQNKVEPLEASAFFPDEKAARQLPPHTVARSSAGAKIAPYTGLTVAPARVGPPQVTMQVLRRGQERFNIFCSPCHSRVGDGRGMIVQRGFKQPTSFHDPRLVAAPTDYFVQVITEGFGVMPSYAPQVPMDDRWAIAYYVRALQYSQNARLADLPDTQRLNVERMLANPQQGPGGLDPGVPSVPEEHLDDARSETPMEMDNDQ